MTVMEIGRKLVELCRAHRDAEALSLYDAKAVSVEARASEAVPAVTQGVDAIRAKGEWWTANHEVHSGEAKGPFPNGDRFAVVFNYEVTPKVGPMSGQRVQMEEVALYTVADGKIVREEFFYSMG
jgi:hypothetical protein